MATDHHGELVTVQLPLPVLHGLLALTHLLDGPVMGALRGAICGGQKDGIAITPQPEPDETPSNPVNRTTPIPHYAELEAIILGTAIEGRTLPDLFGRCVDLIHDLDPIAIERLALVKTHARRYVARRPREVHFRSPHLTESTMQTESGWWISTNVGEQQVTTAMRLLADAANLTFGVDVLFPLAEK